MCLAKLHYMLEFEERNLKFTNQKTHEHSHIEKESRVASPHIPEQTGVYFERRQERNLPKLECPFNNR